MNEVNEVNEGNEGTEGRRRDSRVWIVGGSRESGRRGSEEKENREKVRGKRTRVRIERQR